MEWGRQASERTTVSRESRGQREQDLPVGKGLAPSEVARSAARAPNMTDQSDNAKAQLIQPGTKVLFAGKPCVVLGANPQGNLVVKTSDGKRAVVGLGSVEVAK